MKSLMKMLNVCILPCNRYLISVKFETPHLNENILSFQLCEAYCLEMRSNSTLKHVIFYENMIKGAVKGLSEISPYVHLTSSSRHGHKISRGTSDGFSGWRAGPGRASNHISFVFHKHS